MGGGQHSRGRPASDAGKAPEQSAEKKKVFWMNFIKPPNEEKDHWVSLVRKLHYFVLIVE
jgi:hypothetical protein